jgi:3-hydroxybutyryl-CoA dehydratase
MNVEVGQKASYERTFTVKDVEQFADLSGDRGEHHLRPDKDVRIMLHGLLTATVPTKLGGDMNYIAREITYEFLRPVFTGDKVRADAVVTKVEQSEDHLKVAMGFVCYNQLGKEVLRGRTHGVIRTP